jgi:circadian clock protein KaiC
LILKLKLAESEGTRHRVLYVLKSRGMAHSLEKRGFELGEHGLRVGDRYVPEAASAS